MSRINFYQNNYIGKLQDGTEIKICPSCGADFSVNKDDCPECDLYLPSFPTSWARSATNIFLLRKVLEYLHIDLNGKCDARELSILLTNNNLITYNHTRADDESYWRGGPMRRASEYLSNLQYLGFVIKKDNKYEITKEGEKLILSKDYSDYINTFATAFMHLKITNEFDTRGFYSEYNNHILFQSLRIVDDLEDIKKTPSIENIALAIMAKNENEEYQKAIETSKKYTAQEIKKIWFSRGREFDRVIRGVFVRWLSQTKMIDVNTKNGTTYVTLTNFGKEILNKYKDIYIKSIHETRTKDIRSIIESTIDKRYLRLTISSESSNRTGVQWETLVKKNFNKIDLNVKWYRETQDFANSDLPADVIASLPGGTRHNPDLILHKPLWLIDPKKDVNAEMHKVVAYDKYGEIVGGVSVIVTQKIMKSSKTTIMETLRLQNVLILDGYALQVLSDNKDYFSKEKVISLINKSKGKIYYINEEYIFDNFVG